MNSAINAILLAIMLVLAVLSGFAIAIQDATAAEIGQSATACEAASTGRGI